MTPLEIYKNKEIMKRYFIIEIDFYFERVPLSAIKRNEFGEYNDSAKFVPFLTNCYLTLGLILKIF